VNRLNALFNRVQYDVLYHPFPQRTFIFSGKYEFGTGAKNQPGIFYTGNEEFFRNCSRYRERLSSEREADGV
jgi:hypothetical protein